MPARTMSVSFDAKARRGGGGRAPAPRCLAAGLVVLLAVLGAPPGESQAVALFTAVEEPLPPALSSDDLTLRRRLVTLDLGQVQRARDAATSRGQTTHTKDAASSAKASDSAPTPGTTLTLNLFDDVVVTGRVERVAPTFSGGYSVAGHLVEAPRGTMTLVVNGETVAGTVRRLGETYHIRSVGDGLYAISEVEEPPLTCGVDDLQAEPAHQP